MSTLFCFGFNKPSSGLRKDVIECCLINYGCLMKYIASTFFHIKFFTTLSDSFPLFTCVCVHLYICTYELGVTVCVCVCMYVYIYIYIYIYMCVC